MTDEDSLLTGTVCHGLMVAGIRGPEDSDPPCMGRKCSCYFMCLDDALTAKEKIEARR